MRGVWYTTGGGTGALTAAAAIAAIAGVEWVLQHLWLILATGLGCAVLTGVAIHRLIRWSDQRAVRIWAQRPAQLRAEPIIQIPRPQRQAIAPVHIHFHGLPAADQAAVIRQALPGTPGEPDTGSN